MRLVPAHFEPAYSLNGELNNVKSTLLLLMSAVMLEAQSPSRDDVLKAMRKAADFYRNKVST